DTQAKEVHFEKIETFGEEKIYTPSKESYDFLHFTPPMTAPDFARRSGLCNTDDPTAEQAWITVDKHTMVHTKYPNIVSLGDCSNLPTSKTSAAIRKQVPIAAKNLISLMEGKEVAEKYNGYAACPIVTDYGHVLLCEFDYEKKQDSTFPFSLLDVSKEQWTAWLLKVYILKPLYFYGMLNGLA
ncbi:MAG: FAD/NAD(P)-binding oxidoreductase, partial [Massilibacteroides sp.]|nr:FAD/NAD(P)-binding oxidoreductase [Massilibacteroides sp.]